MGFPYWGNGKPLFLPAVGTGGMTYWGNGSPIEVFVEPIPVLINESSSTSAADSLVGLPVVQEAVSTTAADNLTAPAKINESVSASVADSFYGCGAANNFTYDPHCKALWRFETGALTADSIGANTLSATAGGTADAVNVYEGGSSLLCSNSGHGWYYRTDANLGAGFPLKSGDDGVGTFSFFYKRNAGDGTQNTIFGKWAKNSIYFGDEVGLGAGGVGSFVLRWGYNDSSYEEWTPGVTQYQVPYHVTIKIDGPNKHVDIRIRNCNTQEVNNYSHDFTNALNITDSAFEIGGCTGGPGYSFQNLDELVVFDRLLSDVEADQIWQRYFGAAGYATVDEAVSTSAADPLVGVAAINEAVSLSAAESFAGVGVIQEAVSASQADTLTGETADQGQIDESVSQTTADALVGLGQIAEAISATAADNLVASQGQINEAASTSAADSLAGLGQITEAVSQGAAEVLAGYAQINESASLTAGEQLSGVGQINEGVSQSSAEALAGAGTLQEAVSASAAETFVAPGQIHEGVSASAAETITVQAHGQIDEAVSSSQADPVIGGGQLNEAVSLCAADNLAAMGIGYIVEAVSTSTADNLRASQGLINEAVSLTHADVFGVNIDIDTAISQTAADNLIGRPEVQAAVSLTSADNLRASQGLITEGVSVSQADNLVAISSIAGLPEFPLRVLHVHVLSEIVSYSDLRDMVGFCIDLEVEARPDMADIVLYADEREMVANV